MTIDWTKPVETTEDPPRPVRVLETDHPGKYPVIVSVPNPLIGGWSFADIGLDGTRPNLGVTLRNVPPPKPDPVLHVKWCLLEIDGTLLDYEDEAEARSYQDDKTAECRRIAWMSDGSPVEGK